MLVVTRYAGDDRLQGMLVETRYIGGSTRHGGSKRVYLVVVSPPTKVV